MNNLMNKTTLLRINKPFISLLMYLFLISSIFAQSPEKMSYQAVIRDAGGNLISDNQIGMQISILQGSASGTTVYEETQDPTTNANGLVSIEIGAGAVLSGDFAAIDWASGPYFIKTETDPAGGANYTITGVSQLLSVPYAMHATTALTIVGEIPETDPTLSQNFDFTDAAIGDLLQFDGTKWVKVTPDYLSSYSETDPEFTAWDKDYADLINAPSTITTAQAEAIVANTEKNSYPEDDSIKLAGIADGAEVNVNADWNATSGDNQILNKPTIPADPDGSETKVTAGTNVNITGTGTNANPYVVDASGAITYSVGDFAHGGIVFWVDETGQHGLVAAKQDQSNEVRWYAGTYGFTQANGDGPYAGKANNSIIIAAQVAIGDDGLTYAARICNELQITENGKKYADWYLPSKEELNLMYQNKATINAAAIANGGSSFASPAYWSSTENGSFGAWEQGFGSGNQYGGSKGSTSGVRAVRSF